MTRGILLIASVFLFTAALIEPTVCLAQAGRSEGDFAYARKLYDDGHFDLAAKAFENYLNTYPDGEQRAQSEFLLGESLFQLNEFDNALAAFLRLSFEFSADPLAGRALLRAADCYDALGERERSARTLLRLTAAFPRSPDAPEALFRAARIFLELGEKDNSESSLQQLFSHYPDYSGTLKARLLWAKLLAGRGEADEAIREVSALILKTNDPNLAAEMLNFRAVLFDSLGRPDEAELDWRKIAEKYTGTAIYPSALSRLGGRLIETGEYEEALTLFERALKNARENAVKDETLLGKGDALFLLGRYPEALEAYNSSSDMGSRALVFRRALCLEREGKNSEALELYRSLIKPPLDETGRAALWRSGGLLEKLDRFSEAGRTFERAEEEYTEPRLRAEARWRAASAWFRADPVRCAGLLGDYSQAYPASPFVDDALYLLGRAYLAASREEDAREAFDRLAREFPYSPFFPQARRQSEYLTTHLIRSGDPMVKMAALMGEFNAGLDPDEMALRLGEINLEDIKDYSAAEKQFNRVIQNPGALPVQVEKARILLAETVWREWRKASWNIRDAKPDTSAGVRRLAAETAERIRRLVVDVTDPDVLDENRFRVTSLEIFSYSGAERVMAARNGRRAFLLDNPNTSHRPETLLELGNAFSTTIPQDSARSGDSLAIVYLRELVDEMPEARETVPAQLLLGDLLFARGDTVAAEEAYQFVVEFANGPERVTAFTRMIDLPSLPVRRRLEMVDEIRVEAFYHPAAQRLRETAAEILLQGERREDALEELQAIAGQHEPGNPGLIPLDFHRPMLYFLLAEAEEKTGRTAQALKDYNRYLAQAPGGEMSLEAHRRMARMLVAEKNYLAAIDHLDRMIEQEHDPAMVLEGLRGRANIAFTLSQYDQAREFAARVAAEETNPDSAFVFDRMAVTCLYRLGKLDEARRAVQKLRKRFSGRDDLDEALGEFYLEKGIWFAGQKDWPEVEKAFRTVLRKYGRTSSAPYAQFELGRSFLTMNRDEEGLKLLTGLRDIYPDHPILAEADLALGGYYVQAGNLVEGITMFERVLGCETCRKLWPDALRSEIRAYDEAGFYAGALKAVQTYLSLYPDADDVFRLKMDMGRFYIALEQYDNAVELFRGLLVYTNAEDEAACRFYIGEALDKQGRYDEAIIEYLKVTYLSRPTKLPWAVTALYNAGRVYEKLGDPQKAIEMYQRIVAREGTGSAFGRKAQEQVDRLTASGAASGVNQNGKR